MKKTILTISLFIAIFFSAISVSANVIIYSNGEKVEVVKELPEDAVLDGEHVNLGVMYNQFSIFWIPMWNYGETKYVLLNDAKDTYYDLDAEDLEMLRSEFNIKISDKPSIGFWNKIGGKIIWILVIALVIFVYWVTRKDNEDAEIPR